MQKFITRTVEYTTIKGFIVQIGGDNVNASPIVKLGRLDEEKAMKEFRKEYGYNTIVTDIEYSSEFRRMPVEMFIENSEKVVKEEK